MSETFTTMHHVLMDIADYFRECKSNASPGSAAEKRFDVYVSAITDADRMLKSKEPRVLTLEEVKNLDDHDVVYLETTIGDPINTAIYQPDNGDDDYACIVSTWLKSGFYSWSTYGKEWRCWSSRPTDEQREATPWTE